MNAKENANGASAQPDCSTTIGEFTDARGKVRQCMSLGVLEAGRCKGLLKIRYSRNGQAVVGYILPHEFRSDDARRREQDRLRHMEIHSTDIYGQSSNRIKLSDRLERRRRAERKR